MGSTAGRRSPSRRERSSSLRISRTGPSAATRPRSRTTTRRASRTTSERRCSMRTTVTPSSRLRRSSVSRRARTPRTSRPARGSSSTSTSGRMVRTAAVATRCLFAAGQRGGRPGAQVLERAGGRGPLDPGRDLRRVEAEVARAEGELLLDGETEELLVDRTWETVPTWRAVAAGPAVESWTDAGHPHSAVHVSRQHAGDESGDDPRQRALAAAGRSGRRSRTPPGRCRATRRGAPAGRRR